MKPTRNFIALCEEFDMIRSVLPTALLSAAGGRFEGYAICRCTWLPTPTPCVCVACHLPAFRNDIAGWCESHGALATWNIFRRGFAEEEAHAPDVVLDHSRCALQASGRRDRSLQDAGAV